MQNCALGNCAASWPMKGMLPPSPEKAHAWPWYLVEVVSSARANQSSRAGASKPELAPMISHCI